MNGTLANPSLPLETLPDRQDSCRVLFGSRPFLLWALLSPTLLTLVRSGKTARRYFCDEFHQRAPGLDEPREWIWLQNYREVLQDSQWWLAVRNTLVFSFVSVSIETILGLAIALVLQAEFKGRAFVRAAVLVPWVIPTVVSANSGPGCSTICRE